VIRYLLDTCICVDMIRKKPPVLRRRFAQCPFEAVAISSITFAELLYGVAKSVDPPANRTSLAEFCAPLAIVPFGRAAANAYGELRAALERAGTPIGPLDLLIAAHGVALGATVVTSNDREFRRVPSLVVENWLSPTPRGG